MHTKQKIAFLLADYAVRVIAARQFSELRKLPPIRSAEISDDAWIIARNIAFSVQGYTARIAYNAARAASNAGHKEGQSTTIAAIHTMHNAISDAPEHSIQALINTYNIDMRALINIALDPDRYW